MDIKVKTGFFSTKAYTVTFETDRMVLCAGDESRELAYSALEDVAISHAQGRLPRLELAAGIDLLEAEFVCETDSEVFLKKLGEMTGAGARVDFRMSRPYKEYTP